MILSFCDDYAMYIKHEFALDAIDIGTHTFGILHDGVTVLVSIDEVGYVRTGPFNNPSVRGALGRYERVWHLLSKVGDHPCTLEQVQLIGAPMLFA